MMAAVTFGLGELERRVVVLVFHVLLGAALDEELGHILEALRGRQR